MSSLVWNLIINDRGAAGVNSFRNQLERARKASDENGFSIARASGKIASFSTGLVKTTGKIGAFSVASAHAAPAIGGVVSGLASMSGVLGLIPGLIASGGVAMATFKLGTAGVGDALKLAAAGGKEYEAALKELAPSQREFVKATAGQADGLKKVKQNIGQNLFKGLGKDVSALGKTYLPIVSSSLGFVASGFNRAARETTAWLKQSSTINKVHAMLASSGITAVNFSKALKPIAAGLLNIFTASSRSLPGLTSGIGDAAQAFEKWTEKITAGGKGGAFRKWIDEGLNSVGHLGSALATVGRIIASVFGAAKMAPGGGGLERLAETLHKVEDAVKGPAFQGGLKRVFEAIAQSSDAVSAAIPGVLQAVAKLAPAFANVIQAGGTSFGATLQIIGDVAVVAAPAVNKLSEALVPMAPLIGTLAPAAFLFAKALKLWSIIGPIIAATRLWIIAQGGLNAVLIANPIGIVVVAIALLVAGFVLAYKKSETFRTIVNAAFKATANGVIGAINAILNMFGMLFSVLGKVPGKVGAPFRSAAKAVDAMKGRVANLQASINRLHGKEVRILVDTHYRKFFDSEVRRDAATAGRAGHAEGGEILAGAAAIVGERGPEIRIPATRETILPNSVLRALQGRSAAGNVVYHLYIQGSVLSTKRELRELLIDAVNRAPAGSRRLDPAAIARGGV